MKVLIDTNVALDVLQRRRSFFGSAFKIWTSCEARKITGYLSALSIANIVYIMRKELNPETTRSVIDQLFCAFFVEDFYANDLELAAEMGFTDFEDALQSVCAARVGADYIVTRNVRDFTGSAVPAIEPDALMTQLVGQQ